MYRIIERLDELEEQIQSIRDLIRDMQQEQSSRTQPSIIRLLRACDRRISYLPSTLPPNVDALYIDYSPGEEIGRLLILSEGGVHRRTTENDYTIEQFCPGLRGLVSEEHLLCVLSSYALNKEDLLYILNYVKKGTDK